MENEKTMKIKEQYDEWHARLQQQYVDVFHIDEYISDGVIVPELYANSPIKIMFLNREPNDSENSYDLAEEICKKIQNDERIFSDGKSEIFRNSITYDMIVASCLLHPMFPNLSKNDFEELIQNFDDKSFTEVVKRSAFCNIKKSGGGNRIKSWNVIRKHYLKGTEILFKQIKYFNPTIIFCGNIVDEVLDIDVPENRFHWSKKIDVRGTDVHFYVCAMELDGHVYPIVDLYHPSYVWLHNNTDYWFEILKGMQNVEKENPGFWASHINQPCFEE